MPEHTYTIVPFSISGFSWVGVLLLLAAVIPLGLLCFAIYSSRNAAFTISSEGVRITRDIYGRNIPASLINAAETRVVDLNSDPQLGLTWKTNGISLPGYHAGWFRTKGGGKALAFVTDKSRVAAVPTLDGYTLLVSVPSPENFVRDVKASVRRP